MKLSFIGYPALWQRQSWMLEELADLVDVRVEVPPKWRDKTPSDHLSMLQYATHRTLLTDRIRFHVQPGIARSINAWDPDVVMSWVEPHHLNSTFIDRVDAPLVYFTWETLEHVPDSRLLRWAEGRAYSRADGFVCGSDRARERTMNRGFDGPVEVFPQTGINTDVFAPGEGEHDVDGVDAGAGVVLFVGRLEEEKGLEYLIRAVNGTGHTLLLAGEGADRSRLEALAAEEDVDARFLGWTDYEELPGLYNAADVFVFPSVAMGTWEEQFGYAMFEALSCATPVVATDCGEIPDVTPDCVDIVPQRDPEALRDRITHHVEAGEPVSEGRAWVEDNLTNRRIAERYAAFGRDIVAEET